MSHSVQCAKPFSCARCRRLTHPCQASGLLHIRFPSAHTQVKVIQLLKSLCQQITVQNDVITLPFISKDAIALFTQLMQVLTPMEQDDVKVLFQPEGKVMELQDYFGVESLHRFWSLHQSSWLVDVIEGNQLFTLFQPIVEAQSTNVFAYECLLRGKRDNQVILPGQLFGTARDAGMLFRLDVAARLAAIEGAANCGIRQKVFINFLPNAIYDPQTCLRKTISALDRSNLKRDQVVFEVVESDRITDLNHLLSVLDFYRAEGFEVALDDLGAGYSSLNLLHELKPNYVKLDMGLIQNVHGDRYKGLLAEKLLEIAHLLGVKTIAEGIECQEDYEWLRQRQVDYMQGYYFSPPIAPPIAPPIIPMTSSLSAPALKTTPSGTLAVS